MNLKGLVSKTFTDVKTLYKKIPQAYKSLAQKGFFAIIFSSTLVKLVSSMSAILMPRILTYEDAAGQIIKDDYGLLAETDNIRNYFILFCGLGLFAILSRYCPLTEDKERHWGYFKFAMISGGVFNIVLLVVSIVVYMYIPLSAANDVTARRLLIWLALFPMLNFILSCVLYYLRGTFNNRYYSVLSFLFAFFSVILQISLAYFFRLNGIIIGRYLSIIITIFIGFIILYKLGIKDARPVYPDKKEQKLLYKYSITLMFSNAMSMLMPLNELYLLGLFVQNTAVVADYRAGSMLPANIVFITDAIMIFAFPYFAKYSHDRNWVWKRFISIMKIVLSIFIPLITLLIIFSPYLMTLIFGKAYITAVPFMRILWVVYGIQACVRGVAGWILTALGEVKFTFILSSVVLVLHFTLDLFLVSRYGAAGAAWGLLIAFSVYSIASVIKLSSYRKPLKAAS